MQKTPGLGRQFPVGPWRLTEIFDVQEVLLPHAPVLGEWRFVGIVGRRGILQADDRQDPLGVAQCQVVDGEGAKVQPGEHRPVHADMVQQSHQVGGDMVDIVGLHRRRRIGLAHTPHIRRDHPVTGLRQSGDLAMPAEPKVRETVAQDDGQALALLHVVHVDAVDFGVMVVPVH